MMDDPKRLRDRTASRARGYRSPGGGAPSMLAQVYANPTVPTAAMKYFSAYRATRFGPEAEGGAGALAVDTSAGELVAVLGGRVPVAGDILVCDWIDHRWVAEGLTVTNTSVTVTVYGCNGMPLPFATLTATKTGQTPIVGTTDAYGVLIFPQSPSGWIFAASPRFAATGPVGTTLTLVPASTYVCCASSPWPVSKTLFVATPSGMQSLTYVTGSTPPRWALASPANILTSVAGFTHASATPSCVPAGTVNSATTHIVQCNAGGLLIQKSWASCSNVSSAAYVNNTVGTDFSYSETHIVPGPASLSPLAATTSFSGGADAGTVTLSE